MAEKHIKTRVVQRYDLEVNWNKIPNFVPKPGEFIVYSIEVDAQGNSLELPEGRTEPYTYCRFKIGDGIHTIINLPFASGSSSTEEIEGYNGEVEVI